MINIIIAGSRQFNDYKLVEKSCHKIFYTLAKQKILSGHIKDDVKNMQIISGGAYGADSLGEKFARQYKISIKNFFPRWDVYGKRAGYLRNKEMAEYAAQNPYGILIAFWDMKSRGTKHMIDLATMYKLRVFIIDTNLKTITDRKEKANDVIK